MSLSGLTSAELEQFISGLSGLSALGGSSGGGSASGSAGLMNAALRHVTRSPAQCSAVTPMYVYEYVRSLRMAGVWSGRLHFHHIHCAEAPSASNGMHGRYYCCSCGTAFLAHVHQVARADVTHAAHVYQCTDELRGITRHLSATCVLCDYAWTARIIQPSDHVESLRDLRMALVPPYQGTSMADLKPFEVALGFVQSLCINALSKSETRALVLRPEKLAARVLATMQPDSVMRRTSENELPELIGAVLASFGFRRDASGGYDFAHGADVLEDRLSQCEGARAYLAHYLVHADAELLGLEQSERVLREELAYRTFIGVPAQFGKPANTVEEILAAHELLGLSLADTDDAVACLLRHVFDRQRFVSLALETPINLALTVRQDLLSKFDPIAALNANQAEWLRLREGLVRVGVRVTETGVDDAQLGSAVSAFVQRERSNPAALVLAVDVLRDVQVWFPSARATQLLASLYAAASVRESAAVAARMAGARPPLPSAHGQAQPELAMGSRVASKWRASVLATTLQLVSASSALLGAAMGGAASHSDFARAADEGGAPLVRLLLALMNASDAGVLSIEQLLSVLQGAWEAPLSDVVGSLGGSLRSLLRVVCGEEAEQRMFGCMWESEDGSVATLSSAPWRVPIAPGDSLEACLHLAAPQPGLVLASAPTVLYVQLEGAVKREAPKHNDWRFVAPQELHLDSLMKGVAETVRAVESELERSLMPDVARLSSAIEPAEQFMAEDGVDGGFLGLLAACSTVFEEHATLLDADGSRRQAVERSRAHVQATLNRLCAERAALLAEAARRRSVVRKHAYRLAAVVFESSSAPTFAYVRQANGVWLHCQPSGMVSPAREADVAGAVARMGVPGVQQAPTALVYELQRAHDARADVLSTAADVVRALQPVVRLRAPYA